MILVFLLLRLIAPAAALPAQRGGGLPTTPMPRGTATVEGRVIDAGTGDPVAGAVVRAQVLPEGFRPVPGQPVIEPAQATTGAGGGFSFSSLPAGSLNLYATAAGYVPAEYRPDSRWRLPFLREGQHLRDVVVRLPRFATVSGVVHDENGEPMAGVAVQAFGRSDLPDRSAVYAEAPVVTDQHGVYTLRDVRPGEYVVAVPVLATTTFTSVLNAYRSAGTRATDAGRRMLQTLEDSRPPLLNGLGIRIGEHILAVTGGTTSRAMAPVAGSDGSLFTYRTTFYTTALTLNEATKLSIGSGEERKKIDIHLRRTRASKVSGTLAGPDGPASFMTVRLVATGVDDLYNDRDAEIALTVTDASGAFTSLGVPDGHYLVKAYALREPGRNPSPLSSTGLQRWVQTSVSVKEPDVKVPPLTLRSPLTVSGEVVFAGLDEPADAAVPITVWLGFVGPTPIHPPRTATGGSGRQFTITGLIAGRYRILTNTWGGWRVQSITAAGRDAAGIPIELVDRNLTDVRITLARIRHDP